VLLRKCNNFVLSIVTAVLTLLSQENLTYVTLFYFIFTTNSVPMPAKSNEKAKMPRVVNTMETKLKIIADYGGGK
jgi:hypothetical protein